MITSESNPRTPTDTAIDACHQVQYEPALMEEAVMLAVKDRPEEKSLHRVRDPIYEIADEERRNICFNELHRTWFDRLNLQRPIQCALAERPILASTTHRTFVARVARRKDETAELFVGQKDGSVPDVERRSIGIMLRPASFINADGLLKLLRHELLHIADMLDPAFEYSPAFSLEEDATIPETAFLERYRALWDATVDGRLVHAGLNAPSQRARKFADFAKVFGMFGERTEEAFSLLFDRSGHTHPQLVAFAHAPRELLR